MAYIKRQLAIDIRSLCMWWQRCVFFLLRWKWFFFALAVFPSNVHSTLVAIIRPLDTPNHCNQQTNYVLKIWFLRIDMSKLVNDRKSAKAKTITTIINTNRTKENAKCKMCARKLLHCMCITNASKGNKCCATKEIAASWCESPNQSQCNENEKRQPKNAQHDQRRIETKWWTYACHARRHCHRRATKKHRDPRAKRNDGDRTSTSASMRLKKKKEGEKERERKSAHRHSLCD